MNKGWVGSEKESWREIRSYNVGSIVSVMGKVEILAGNNINIKAGNGINQVGSEVKSQAGNISYEGKEVKITASRDSRRTKDKEDTYKANVTIGTGGVSGSLSFNLESANSSAENYNNSTVQADKGKVTIRQKKEDGSYEGVENLEISGAVIAAKEVDISAKKMKIESKQNKYEGKSKSVGMSVGISGGSGFSMGSFAPASGGGGFGGGSISASYGQSKEGRNWVDDQTMIIGSEKVSIDVSEGKLTNIGALIANADYESGSVLKENYEGEREKKGNEERKEIRGEDLKKVYIIGEDKGNVEIRAKEIENIEIEDKYYYDNYNYGGAIGLGDFSNAKNAVKELNATLYHYEGKQEGKTRATIGDGKIFIDGKLATASELKGLNREISKRQEAGKYQQRRALNAQARIDVRFWLSAAEAIYKGDINKLSLWQDIKAIGYGVNIIDTPEEKAEKKRREELKKAIEETAQRMRENKEEAKGIKDAYISNLIENKDYTNLMSMAQEEIRNSKEIKKEIEKAIKNNDKFYKELNKYVADRQKGLDYVLNEIEKKVKSGVPANEIPTYCNLDIEKRLARDYEIIIPANGREGKTANGIYDYVSGSQDWGQVDRTNGNLDHEGAQKLAAEGYVVLAVYKNQSGASGHVVFVTGKSLEFGKVWIEGLNTIDRENQEVREERFSKQFASHPVVNNTEFFYYKIKSSEITTGKEK
jgi:hypothetical protein